jgi:hypothetical protein
MARICAVQLFVAWRLGTDERVVVEPPITVAARLRTLLRRRNSLRPATIRCDQARIVSA